MGDALESQVRGTQKPTWKDARLEGPPAYWWIPGTLSLVGLLIYLLQLVTSLTWLSRVSEVCLSLALVISVTILVRRSRLR